VAARGVSVKVEGVEDVKKALREAGSRLRLAAERAVAEETAAVAQDMRQHAPVDEGELRASIRPEHDGLEVFRSRYQAFTVDEYQDVNLLQQTLLERWLGGRDDLCVVGDDYDVLAALRGG